MESPPEDLKVAKAIWKMYHHFTVTGQVQYKDLVVPKVTKDSDDFLEIKQDPEIKTGFKPEHFDFWIEKVFSKRWP